MAQSLPKRAPVKGALPFFASMCHHCPTHHIITQIPPFPRLRSFGDLSVILR